MPFHSLDIKIRDLQTTNGACKGLSVQKAIEYMYFFLVVTLHTFDTLKINEFLVVMNLFMNMFFLCKNSFSQLGEQQKNV